MNKEILCNAQTKTAQTQQVQQNHRVQRTQRLNIKQQKMNKAMPGVKMRVGATAYCGDTITSTGTVPIEGTTIAVDPKVIPYGTKVYIPQFDRIFIAEDCGSAIKGNRIDIFTNSYSYAISQERKVANVWIISKKK
jgi:3D (Asp-Asp-Asp) domain-containing protein